MRRDDVNELIEALAGTVLTHLSGMAARCSRDMVVRRSIDAVVDPGMKRGWLSLAIEYEHLAKVIEERHKRKDF